MRLPNAFLLAATVMLGMTALAGCHSRTTSSGLTPVKFQADWYPQPEHGGFYDALVKGYYKDEGLDVEILPGGPYVSSDALVASGAVSRTSRTSLTFPRFSCSVMSVYEPAMRSGEP